MCSREVKDLHTPTASRHRGGCTHTGVRVGCHRAPYQAPQGLLDEQALAEADTDATFSTLNIGSSHCGARSVSPKRATHGYRPAAGVPGVLPRLARISSGMRGWLPRTPLSVPSDGAMAEKNGWEWSEGEGYEAHAASISPRRSVNIQDAERP